MVYLKPDRSKFTPLRSVDTQKRERAYCFSHPSWVYLKKTSATAAFCSKISNLSPPSFSNLSTKAEMDLKFARSIVQHTAVLHPVASSTAEMYCQPPKAEDEIGAK